MKPSRDDREVPSDVDGDAEHANRGKPPGPSCTRTRVGFWSTSPGAARILLGDGTEAGGGGGPAEGPPQRPTRPGRGSQPQMRGARSPGDAGVRFVRRGAGASATKQTRPNAAVFADLTGGWQFVMVAHPRCAWRFGPIAQGLERPAHNRLVLGSNPSGPTGDAIRLPGPAGGGGGRRKDDQGG